MHTNDTRDKSNEQTIWSKTHKAQRVLTAASKTTNRQTYQKRFIKLVKSSKIKFLFLTVVRVVFAKLSLLHFEAVNFSYICIAYCLCDQLLLHAVVDYIADLTVSEKDFDVVKHNLKTTYFDQSLKPHKLNQLVMVFVSI